MSTARLEPMFSRHETFPPRFGWFKKLHEAVSEDSTVFTREDATLVLGVGKNMVRAIRFWGGAADLIQPRRPVRKEGVSLTEFARTVLSDNGWDPYLELPATVWLLHWRFFGPGCQLPVWWYAFHDYTDPDFSVAGLATEATKAISALYDVKDPSANSVRRDVECLVHTYSRRPDGRTSPEDIFACPFRALGLIELEPGRSGIYRFRIGSKPSLPDPVVLFAALDFADRWNRSARSISLGRLVREHGAPGPVFKLDEDALLRALTAAAGTHEAVRVTDTAGVSALHFDGEPRAVALDVLNRYFSRCTGSRKRLAELPGEPPILSTDRPARSDHRRTSKLKAPRSTRH